MKSFSFKSTLMVYIFLTEQIFSLLNKYEINASAELFCCAEVHLCFSHRQPITRMTFTGSKLSIIATNCFFLKVTVPEHQKCSFMVFLTTGKVGR
uniref:Uncharacterized protein n=1 Tax=Anguilla anguilla TaxID=7936 RepID=A0A0E9SCQ9_ANGAN